MPAKYAVFIGRLQPPHKSHIALIKQALTECQELILVLGSARATQDIKNPFTFQERSEMVRACLEDGWNKRLHIVGVRDYFYNENAWIAEVQQTIQAITGGDPSVSLYGSYKDASSYYINHFPQWDFTPARSLGHENATDVRSAIFEHPFPAEGWEDSKLNWKTYCPAQIVEWIESKFLRDGAFAKDVSPRFTRLQNEYNFIKGYREQWKDAPFAPTFVTADAVVVQSGHLLVVERGKGYGKDLLALPGGFINQGERIQSAAIRELKEETRIKIPVAELAKRIVNNGVFDYPGRSLRGRTITHAYHFDLGYGELPEVKGSDDAQAAKWLPLADVLQAEGKFFEDHWHIAYHFITQSRKQ